MPFFKKIGKDYFFHSIVAIDPRDPGDYGYVLRSAIKELHYRDSDYPAGFRSTVSDVGRYFRKNGALFIPAHLHQSKAPENSRSVDDLYSDDAFLGFIEDKAFDALEVRQKQTAEFFDGEHITGEKRRIPLITCVSSSDAHHHDHLSQRQRSTWVRAEQPTFAELKAALSLPHRVTLESPSMDYPRVVGLHIVGSFVKECWLNLNEGLNALIGSKGSGKTALLECFRFVLNAPIPKERAEAVAKHMQHILGSSGYVKCDHDIGGSERLITRRADSPSRIATVDEGNETRIRSADGGSVFPVSILGWHEIESVADRAPERIALLDRVGDPTAIRTAYETIQVHIDRARDQLPLLQRQVRRLDSSLKQLWELQHKRSTLKRFEEGDLSILQRQYEWFLLTEQKVSAIGEDIRHRREEISEAVASHLDVEFTQPPDPGSVHALSDLLGKVVEGGVLNKKAEASATGVIADALEHLQDFCTQAVADALASSFTDFRDGVYTPKVNALVPEDREILSRQIQVLEDTKRLPTVEAACNEQLRELRALAQERLKICDAIGALRQSIVATRELLVEKLNSELPGIQLKFNRAANREAHDRFQSSYGPEGVTLVGFVDSLSSGETYERLRALFDKLLQLGAEQDKWNIQETLIDAKLVDFLDVLDDDDVEISLAVGSRGFVPIQNLSAGQRCVAVFPLLLRNSRGPLIIDQPEDNLDNRYIADTIGPDLLYKKRSQQYLVTSHNANLVVLTDADLILHVDSDGTSATYPASGFLACSESPVRTSVLDVLDGGKQALAARQMKYGM